MGGEGRVEFLSESSPRSIAAGDYFTRGLVEFVVGGEPVRRGLTLPDLGVDSIGVLLPGQVVKDILQAVKKIERAYIHFIHSCARVVSSQLPLWMNAD